jgi:hypothetical protein
LNLRFLGSYFSLPALGRLPFCSAEDLAAIFKLECAVTDDWVAGIEYCVVRASEVGGVDLLSFGV